VAAGLKALEEASPLPLLEIKPRFNRCGAHNRIDISIELRGLIK